MLRELQSGQRAAPNGLHAVDIEEQQRASSVTLQPVDSVDQVEHTQAEAADRLLGELQGCTLRRPPRSASGKTALTAEPQPVVHTSHPSFGYVISNGRRRVAWAPEFWTFPDWAADVDLMFWSRRIRFAGGVGGHAAGPQIAEEARNHGVRRLVFAHIGLPTVRAIDAGERLPFGEVGAYRRRYRV
jgi:hypothetical protein